MTDPIQMALQAAQAAKVVDPTSSEAAKTGAKLWGDMLGPPARAYGQHLARRIEFWSEDKQARRVLERAALKTDSSEPGRVPPRVAADVFEKAQWADDEFVAEYLSGVLASARTIEGKDDSAVSWTALVGRMSSDQLRMHYSLYSLLRSKAVGTASEDIGEWEKRLLLVEYSDVLASLGWDEDDYVQQRILDAVYGLERERLVANIGHGTVGFWEKYWTPKYKKQLPPSRAGYFSFHATAAGSGLFLRAHGYGRSLVSTLLDPETNFGYKGEPATAVEPLRGYWIDELPPVPA